MADGGAGSCLSDLSDDLLQHILSFAVPGVRAATALLSRRWLRLWRSSGDVYLDSRSFSFNGGCEDAPDQESEEAFLRGAEKALAVAAAHGHIRRLTISIPEDTKIILHHRVQAWPLPDHDLIEHNLIDALVSNPAARHVEELKIEVPSWNLGFEVSFGSLPSEALRVLRLNCRAILTAPVLPGVAAAAFFPMLVELDLQGGNITVVDLKTIIDGAPQLSILHLALSCISGIHDEVGELLIPAVTDLTVSDYGWRDQAGLELVVPRLQYFRYRGNVQRTNHLSLKRQGTSSLVQVDLHLSFDYNDYMDDPIHNLFWKFIQNFNTTKHLKLKLEKLITMDDLAVEDMASRDELLGGLSFDLLEQLELEAKYTYKPGFQVSMVMLANLLHCCPKVRQLQLRFGKHYQNPCWIESSIDMEAGVHFDKCVNGFRNRRRKSKVSVGGQNDANYEVFGIPGFNGEHSFSCLQSHLQIVSMHFLMNEPNCIEVQLARFFAENAMVLQEMHIDDGSQEMLEHVNCGVGNNQQNVKD